MKRPVYVLAGSRSGFELSELDRVDFHPNASGFAYTQFRRADGSIQAVVRSDLLVDLALRVGGAG